MNADKDNTNKPILMNYEHYVLLKQIKNIIAVIQISRIMNTEDGIELIYILTELRTAYESMITKKLFPEADKDYRKNSSAYQCKRMKTGIAYTDRQEQLKQQVQQLCIEEYNQANIAVTYEQYEIFEQISKIDTLIQSLPTSPQSEYEPSLNKRCCELLTDLKEELLNTISQT